jgi:hypothetical protein
MGWYNRPNSGRSTKWTQSHPMREKAEKALLSKKIHFSQFLEVSVHCKRCNMKVPFWLFGF